MSMSRIREGEAIEVGTLRIEPLYTPGHTDDHHAYLLDRPTARAYSPATR